MVNDIDYAHNKKGLRTAEFIEDLKLLSKPYEIPKIFELWESIEYEEYLSNPAICGSRSLGDGQTTTDGTFGIVYTLPDGSEIGEDDIIQWITPGHGRDCGKSVRAHTIESCEHDIGHYVQIEPDHCGSLSCPNCAPYLVQYNSIEQAQKILSGSKYAESNDRADRVLQHIAVSPPERVYYKFLTPDGFAEMSKYAVKIATEIGLKGGMVIFHPYRQNGISDDDDLPEDYVPTATNDGNKRSARFSPHFHIIGFGWVTPSSADFMQTHKGWMYKALRTGQKRLRTLPDVVGVVNYVMSHVGLYSEASVQRFGRKQSINWFGMCNSRVLSNVGEIRVHTQRLCEICGSDFILHTVKGPRNNEIEYKGKSYKFHKYRIYSDSEHKEQLMAFCEENSADPVGILRFIEKHPEMGVCYLTSRELDRKLTAPTPIYAKIDGSVHIPDVYATYRTNSRRKRVKLRADFSGSVSGVRFVSRPDLRPDSIPYIDFTLPPEADSYLTEHYPE